MFLCYNWFMNYNKFFQINENNLTRSEQKVHKFIMLNPQYVMSLTIVQMEEIIFVSRTSIERYFKKAGVIGLKTFKIKLNDYIKNLDSCNTYSEIVNLLNRYRNSNIGIVAQGTSFLSAQYLNRRLKLLQFNSQAENIIDLNDIKTNFDIIIVFSIRGIIGEVLKKIIENHNVTLVAITKKNSELYQLADLAIDNNAPQVFNVYDNDDISQTIIIIEKLIRKLGASITVD